MYVYIYIYIHIFIQVNTYFHTNTYLYMYTYKHIHRLDKEENAKLCDVLFSWLLNETELDMTSDRQVCIYKYIHICVCLYASMYICM
jgi:hypothetical protein